MPPSSLGAPVLIGDFVFDPTTGEAWRRSGTAEHKAEAAADTPPTRPSKFRLFALAVPAVLLAAVGLLALLRPSAPAPTRPVRLAIMPFELAALAGDTQDLARISEWLVAEFSNGQGGGLEVIGPRSTARYSAFPFPPLDRLREELAVDFVVNARSFEEDGEQQLIVELIRLDDRSHPWAAFFTDTRPWETIAREVHRNVSSALRAPP